MMKSILVLLACIAVAFGRDSLTVDPDAGKPAGGSSGPDLSGTDLTTSYCAGKDKECAGTDLEGAKFVPTARQCQIKCTYNVQCLSAFLDNNKFCHLRGKRCSSGELKASTGAYDFYRLKTGEACPADRPPYKESNIAYSNTFCTMKDKACNGHDLYDKPQNIYPLTLCLAKCARITSCASVDFANNKCSPKDHNCKDEELTSNPGSINAMRLEADATGCSPTRALDCGDNSHAQGLVCVCDAGYVPKYGRCVKTAAPTPAPVVCGANAANVGGTCQCNAGFEKSGNDCVKTTPAPVVCGANAANVGGTCQCNSGFDKVGNDCLTSCGSNGKRSGTSCSCNPGFALRNNQCTRSGYSLSGESLYGTCKNRGRHQYCETKGDCNGAIHIIRNIPGAGEDGCKRECDNECACKAFRLHHRNCFLVSTPCSTMDHTLGLWRFFVKAEIGQSCQTAVNGCREQPVEYCRRPGDCVSFNIRHRPVSQSSCESLCTNECACKAYFHDGGLGCWLKSIACTERTHAVTAYGYYIKMAKGEDCDYAIEGRCRNTKFKYCVRNGDCAGHNIRAKAMGVNDCKRACDRECSCKAFWHNRGLGCVLKSIACTKLTHRSPAVEYFVKIGADDSCPSDYGREESSYY